jgi:hypothetical protein
MSRSLCCRSVADAASCTFAVHADGKEMAAAARVALRQREVCITHEYRQEYRHITDSLASLETSAASNGTTAAIMPSLLISAVGPHMIRDRDASLHGMDVDAFLARVAAPAWRGTAVVMHACPSPNQTAIAEGSHSQTLPRVLAFNAALKQATEQGVRAGGAWAGRAAAAPRLVDYFGIAGWPPPPRFPYRDAIHFQEQYFQTAIVLDALVLGAAAACGGAAAADSS